MADKSLNECSPAGSQPDKNLDPLPLRCSEDNIQFVNPQGGVEGLFHKNVPNFDDPTRRKYGLGHANNCDPMQAGKIVRGNEPIGEVIYRQSQGLRAIDEAMKDMFSNIVVQDEQGGVHSVPIIMGGQEVAIAYVKQSNVRKDNSLVVGRIPLPIMSIHSTSPSLAMDRYFYHKAVDYRRRPDGKPGFTIKERYDRDTILGFSMGIPIDVPFRLVIWTTYITDMQQILDQVLQKLTPHGYIRLQGVSNWDNIVRLDNIQDNIDRESGENKRVVKYEISMTVNTYLPQPIYRKKAVLKTSVDIVDGITEEEVQGVIARLEDAVGEFKND